MYLHIQHDILNRDNENLCVFEDFFELVVMYNDK
jgi:hypothetical protein